MRVTIRPYKNIDWFTVAIYVILVIFGWLNIYAANYDPEATSVFDISTEPTRQIIWIGFSFIMIGVLFLIDSKFFVEFAYIFYAISIFLLLVALFFGVEINGAKAWFEIGTMRFQPAEITKVAAALALSRVMSRYNFKMSKIRYLIKMGVVIFLPILIIVMQNDAGSALVYFAFFLVFFREGMSPFFLLIGAIAATILILSLVYETIFIIAGLYLLFLGFVFLERQRRILALFFAITALVFISIYGVSMALDREFNVLSSFIAGTGVSSIYLLVQIVIKKLPKTGLAVLILWGLIGFTYASNYLFNNALSDYQRNRIEVMLGISDDPLGVGYNVNQSKIAIGSGGFYGKGFLEGTQTKFEFVPEQSTDFIFCTVGEEWGFLGTSMVVLLFMVLLLRIVFLAERQHSAFSRIYGYAVVAVFFIHILINIGMTIGLAPVIGIPLPFFSYGGSSLWGFTILLFIFLKLDTNRNELIR